MNPIDQIRKALEALRRARGTNSFDVLDDASSEFWRAASIPGIAALLASHDAAVQRAAEMERERDSFRASMGEWAERFEASQANAATLLQRAKTAEARAAEMQERCARIAEADAPDYRGAEIAAAIRAIKE